MKNYWLTFNPDTFIWLQNNCGLIYNCMNNKSLRFNTNAQIERICKKLLEPESLYSIEISEDILVPLTKLWIENIISNKLASLSETNCVNIKPVSYCPMLKIQRDRHTIIEEHKDGLGGRIIENLDELIFYINGSNKGSSEYYKQMLYPIKSKDWLKLSAIKTLIESSKIGMLHKLTFIGNLLKYPELTKLNIYLTNIEMPINFVILLNDIIKNIKHLKSFQSKLHTISIIVTVNSSIYAAYKFFKENSFANINWIFPIYDEKSYFSIFEKIKRFQIRNYEIIPVYNGKNISFFEKYVFLSYTDINNIKLTKKEIFINMTLNPNSFGKLFVLPDGQVYANVNNQPLGNVNSSIYELLFKEFSTGKSWFNIRNNAPCNKCLYNWICPPPSNYELAIGKPNLCHIKP